MGRHWSLSTDRQLDGAQAQVPRREAAVGHASHELPVELRLLDVLSFQTNTSPAIEHHQKNATSVRICRCTNVPASKAQ